MNFKSVGIAWVGDIYQRFETICDEVDNIVKQDPVKYVEDQVHTVGNSMKKICSEAVQVVDPVRCEAQAMALKGNGAVGDNIKSMIGIEEDHGPTDSVHQLLVEPNDVYAVKNHQPSDEFSGSDLVNQSTTPASGESLVGENFDSARGNDGNCDLSTEDDATKEKLNAPEVLELISPNETKLLNLTLSTEIIVSNNENAYASLDEVLPPTLIGEGKFQSQQEHATANDSDTISDSSGSFLRPGLIASDNDSACLSLEEISPSTSVGGQEFHFPQKVGTVCYSPVNDSDTVSGVSRAVALRESAISYNENTCTSVDDTSPSTSVDGVELQSPQKVGAIYCSHANDPDAVSDASSAVPLSALALSVASSSGSINTEPHTLLENSFNDILTKVISYDDPDNVSACDAGSSNLILSSPSLPIVSGNKEVAETRLTCSTSVHSSELAGCYNDFSYISDDFEGPGMETIDLSDEVKLEESCVMVDDSMLYEASRRIHKLRSFKKKFQDVFNSRKRLSKEYQQLAIWFGDHDTEASQDTAQHQLPSSTTLCFDSDIQILDSEWELL